MTPFSHNGAANDERCEHGSNLLKPDTYNIPMDISCKHLRKAKRCVASEHPWLDVHAVCADITDTISLDKHG